MPYASLPATGLQGRKVEITWPHANQREERTVVAAVPDALGGVILTFDDPEKRSRLFKADATLVEQLRVDVNDAFPDELGNFRAGQSTTGRPNEGDAFLVRLLPPAGFIHA